MLCRKRMRAMHRAVLVVDEAVGMVAIGLGDETRGGVQVRRRARGAVPGRAGRSTRGAAPVAVAAAAP